MLKWLGYKSYPQLFLFLINKTGLDSEQDKVNLVAGLSSKFDIAEYVKFPGPGNSDKGSFTSQQILCTDFKLNSEDAVEQIFENLAHQVDQGPIVVNPNCLNRLFFNSI